MIFKRILWIALMGISINTQGQNQVKSYSLKKGQVFDVVCLRKNDDINSTRARYFETAFVIARNQGYKPLSALHISEVPTQGNYWPELLALGLWTDMKSREVFIDEIENDVPDFHEMRRKIWSTFHLTYWEIKEDMSFNIDPLKFYVLTAYWKKHKKKFRKFKDTWIDTAQKAGGKLTLELTEGISPFGYYYNPDYLVITEWDNKSDFERFKEQNLNMDHSSVKHVNQFIVH